MDWQSVGGDALQIIRTDAAGLQSASPSRHLHCDVANYDIRTQWDRLHVCRERNVGRGLDKREAKEK